MAALDAATRMVTALVRSGGLPRGRPAERVLEDFFERACANAPGAGPAIPAAYWTVQPAPAGGDGEERLFLRGAVLVRVLGRRPAEDPAASAEGAPETTTGPAPLSPELAAALAERPSRPLRELFGLLRADGLLTPVMLALALVSAAGGVLVEVLLFQALFDLSRYLGLAGQRLGAVSALIIFSLALLLLELQTAAGVLRLGRRLENRLRAVFLEKIPRLSDRYFHSRLISDMAERSHSIHKLRMLPDLAGQLLRSIFELSLTTLGIIWLDPAGAPVALGLAALAVILPLAAQPYLVEQDLRARSHDGALSRFYLDALLGLVAIRTHRAERAIRREHESLLVEWARAGLGLQRAVVAAEGLQALVGFGLAAGLLLNYLTRAGEGGGVLLLIYWVLNLPALGQQVALVAWQYPAQRNMALRLVEPLGAPEGDPDPEVGRPAAGAHRNGSAGPSRGVAIVMEGVTVRAAGHTILEDVRLTMAAGRHVAIVGSSGAGKSSLVGLLLGWHRPAAGAIRIDGEPLDARRLEQLRRETAWVDPAVQLWNRSLLENLRYGSAAEESLSPGAIIEAADLRSALERLPDGWQTVLGEGGALVSGGEGQRARLGRALLRPDVRLVILDEPFRGLDREQRRKLLARARHLWRDATLLCITHDVGETQAFERVLVIADGRIVEDGDPATLAAQPDSRYRSLLEAEAAVRTGLWSGDTWRRVWLEGGRLDENHRKDAIL